MEMLTTAETETVAGGDSWAGTPEGRAAFNSLSQFNSCVQDAVLAGNPDPFNVMVGCAIQTWF